MTSATGNKKTQPAARAHRDGFSLIELLTVVAIMALVMGLVAVGITGMARPGLQTAGTQVASGMSLARQLAISKNSPAAFIIATSMGTNLPSQPYKYWAVAVSNRATTNWNIQKDWERLPEGAVFLEAMNSSTYKTINPNAFPNDVTVGAPYAPPAFPNPLNFTVTYGTNTNKFTFPASLPAIIFLPDGSANGNAVAVRLADGTIDASNKVILRNTNRYMFVETDATVGRVRVRTPESYR